MGRVFFNTYKRIQNVTADYTVDVQQSGTTFIVLPAATTLITLPTPGTTTTTAGEGWNCEIILQSDSGFGGDAIMDQKVNISLGDDTNNVGISVATDGDAGDITVDGDDFIACTANATPGDTFRFISDGTRWFIQGIVADGDECPFAAAAG